METLREAKKISSMEITRDRGSDRLWLSQENYVFNVLERFNMAEARSSPLLAGHFKLSSKQCPQSPEEEMSRVSYASAGGSLMYYAMVSASRNLAYSASIISRFMLNPGKQHWEAMK